MVSQLKLPRLSWKIHTKIINPHETNSIKPLEQFIRKFNETPNIILICFTAKRKHIEDTNIPEKIQENVVWMTCDTSKESDQRGVWEPSTSCERLLASY